MTETDPAIRSELGVLWISASGWEDQLELHPLRDPIPLATWLRLIRDEGMEVVLLPYDTLIEGGPCDGGRVVAVEAAGGRHFFALPPEALPTLKEFVTKDAYAHLVSDTPRLLGVEVARAVLGAK